MTIGKRIKAYREACGIGSASGRMTMEELAELSGVERCTIGALEARQSTRTDYRQLRALAHAFGLTMDQFTDDTRMYPVANKDLLLAAHRNGQRAPGVAQPDTLYRPWPYRTPLAVVLALPERQRQRLDDYPQGLIDHNEATSTPEKAA